MSGPQWSSTLCNEDAGRPPLPGWPSHALDRVKDFRDIEPDSSAAKERDRELDALAGQTEETQESIARLLNTLERVTSESVEQRLEELEAKLAELKAPEFTMLGAVRRPDIKRSTQASGRRTFRA